MTDVGWRRDEPSTYKDEKLACEAARLRREEGTVVSIEISQAHDRINGRAGKVSRRPRGKRRQGLPPDQVSEKLKVYPETSHSRHRRDHLTNSGMYPNSRRKPGIAPPKFKTHESNKQYYTLGHGDPMGDTAGNTEDELIAAAQNVPPQNHDIAIRFLKQLAAGEVAAPKPLRLKWEQDAKPNEDPATFAARAGYEHRGQIHAEDKALSLKLRNWLRTYDWPADVRYVPTLPEWNRQQAAMLPELRAKLRDEADRQRAATSNFVSDQSREVRRLQAVVKRSGGSIPAF